MAKRLDNLQTTALLACLIFALTALPGLAAPPQKLAFSGGPNGGTFQFFSNGIATRLSRMEANLEVVNLPSAGSIENIRRINAGDADFGIAYSGDIFLARKGLLTKDQQKYQNVLAVAYLYGAPVQLVVLDESPIKSVKDLIGKKISVGGAGSGSAATAERYFKALSLWDKLNVEYIGYSKAAAALGDKRIDAMWILAGFPTAAVQQAAAKSKVRLIDVWTPAQQSGFFTTFPFYSEVVIPGKTYANVNEPMKSFQDSAIWIAGKQVAADTVKIALEDIFSPEGLDYMVKVKKTAKEMSLKAALTGVVTPVHPGAKEFWKSKGLGFFPAD